MIASKLPVLVLSLAIVLGGSWGSRAQAQSPASLAAEVESLSPEQKKLFTEVADDLRCPTCTGLSVIQSDAAFSLQIRQAVLKLVKEGKSKEAILEFFTERYGLWILREPPTSGFHILAWLVPLLILVFGPLGLWFGVWRKKTVVNRLGVRSTQEILQEFENELVALRSQQKLGDREGEREREGTALSKTN